MSAIRVRYYGHVGRLSGYGRAAAEMCMSLLDVGVELEIVPVGRPSKNEAETALARYPRLRDHLRLEADLTVPDVCIAHTLPLDCSTILNHAIGQDLDPDVPWVAYTTWESPSTIPDAISESLVCFQQIWTPSSVTSRSFAEGRHQRSTTVFTMPHAFNAEATPAPATAKPAGDPFTFYYVGAWNGRKNPAGLIRAFAMAFTAQDRVELVLRCNGATQETFAVALHQTGLSPEDMPRVVFQGGGSYTDAEMTELHADVGDCFVTATRGEAFNLPAFEAMLAGRHIIAPAGMGSDDFLRDTSAELYGGMAAPAMVDVRVTGLVAAGIGIRMQAIGAQGLTSRSTWLEPDLVRLAEAMRNAYLYRRNTLTTNYNPADRYSYAAVGKHALQALEPLA